MVQTALTYHQDVRPIIDRKCNTCHQPGGIGPVPLGSFEEVSAVAELVHHVVEDGQMPPWKPTEGCDDYEGDFSLTAEEKVTLLEWSAGGAPEGDASDPASTSIPGWQDLPRVDVTLEMPRAYTPAGEDDYRCFVVEWPESTTKYVTGANVVPGNRAVVHHLIAYHATPSQADEYRQKDPDGEGYPCFGGTGGPAQSWIAAWAPGADAQVFPAGTGLEVEPGSVIIVQMHYNTQAAGPETDRSHVELMVEDQVDRLAWIQPWTNPRWLQSGGMPIPAMQPDVSHSFAFDPTAFPIMPVGANTPFVIHSANLHMHRLGTAATTSIERQDGTSDCLLSIDDWDFDWQRSYGFTTPKVFHPGDQLRLECHWNNSTGTQAIHWGEGSGDEMCLGVYYMSEL